MISPIRSLCFNDDRQTFTIVLPSQYRIFRCEPFGMIFSRECDDLSLGSVATYDGYRYLALTGSPSPSRFNSKSVRIFDHQSGQVIFEHTFDNHVLALALGKDVIVCAMHKQVEVWNTITNQLIFKTNTGLNVHVPLAISADSSSALIPGEYSESHEYHLGILQNLSQNPQVCRTDIGEETPISLVRFSSDGKFYGSGSFNSNEIRIWNLNSLNLLFTLVKEGNDLVQDFDFSLDSDYVATVSKEGKVRIYSLRRQRPPKTLNPIATLSINQEITMPRLTWTGSSTLGMTSLEGDFYKLELNENVLEYESTTYLKRT